MHLLLNILFKFVFGVTMLYCVTSIHTHPRVRTRAHMQCTENGISKISLKITYRDMNGRYGMEFYFTTSFIVGCIWIFNSDPFLFSA